MNKHDNHQFTLVTGPFIYNNVSHEGKFVCTTCNVYLKWVNKWQIDLYNEHYKKHMTYGQFNKRVDNYMHSVPENDPANIFLAVPFRDKDIVKKLGATWDPYHKLWYTTVRRQHADKLTQYMMPDDIEKLKQMKRSANK